MLWENCTLLRFVKLFFVFCWVITVPFEVFVTKAALSLSFSCVLVRMISEPWWGFWWEIFLKESSLHKLVINSSLYFMRQIPGFSVVWDPTGYSSLINLDSAVFFLTWVLANTRVVDMTEFKQPEPLRLSGPCLRLAFHCSRADHPLSPFLPVLDFKLQSNSSASTFSTCYEFIHFFTG